MLFLETPQREEIFSRDYFLQTGRIKYTRTERAETAGGRLSKRARRLPAGRNEMSQTRNYKVMKRILLSAILLLAYIIASGQDESKFGINWSGFIKTDIFFDSRQTISAREGHFLLWPAAERLDENGVDTYARSNFNILSVQSRLTASISGPDAFGAKTSGLIEADFFAQANDNINLLRLRHAYIKFAWTRLELLTGQYWNPLFVTDCFPGTVSFNTGTPLQSFARNPQVRVAWNAGGLKLTGAIVSQRDYATYGALGASSVYLRNATLPDIHLQAQYGFKDKGSDISFIFGGGAAYKKIVPRLESQSGIPQNRIIYEVDEKVGGFTAIAFTKITAKPFTLKLEGRYGENISDLLAISGFAVREVTDQVTGQSDYTPLKSLTFWGEIHTNGKVQLGLFGGYFKNLGTRDPMSDENNEVIGLATNISSLLRISPRVIVNSGKVRVALEMEYTSADFGSDYDINYIASNTTKVSNLRALLGIYYFF